MEELMTIGVLLFGLVIGSFLNVCIYRLPRGEEIVKKPSHCPNCMSPLTWYEMIPVISFLIQKGRCRNCKEKISSNIRQWNFLMEYCTCGSFTKQDTSSLVFCIACVLRRFLSLQ